MFNIHVLSGMSVLQCASVALKTTVCDVESSRSPLCSRLHSLRKEQMLETLECLLQMGSYPHTVVYLLLNTRFLNILCTLS